MMHASLFMIDIYYATHSQIITNDSFIQLCIKIYVCIYNAYYITRAFA